eukprot:1150452-Pelagomonas_calceolata.AAC.1
MHAGTHSCTHARTHFNADGTHTGAAEEEEEVDVEGLAAQWLDITVTAAANVYAKAIAQVPHVTQQVQHAARRTSHIYTRERVRRRDAELAFSTVSHLSYVPPLCLLASMATA